MTVKKKSEHTKKEEYQGGSVLKRCFVFLFVVFTTAYVFTASSPRARAEELFPPFRYEGILSRDTEELSAGERVTLLEAEHQKYYIVRRANGERKRVSWDAIAPVHKEKAPLRDVSDGEIARAAHELGLTSKTEYLLWVDLSRLCTYVLEYADEGWVVQRRLPCAVGDAAHPTPSGRYAVDYKCACIGKEDAYLCRHALCFYGSYMLHSILFSPQGDGVLDERLGVRISHGCVRHSPADSLWLYKTVGVGTTVFLR